MARVKKSRTTKTTKIEDTQVDPLTDNNETTLMEDSVNEEMDVIMEEETDMLAEEESPAPVEEETPAPVEEESPAPVEEESPAPVEEESPAPVEEESPAPMEEESPAPVEEESPAPVEEESPAPVEEEPSAPVEEESPAPVEEESPAPVEDNYEDIVREVPMDNIPLSVNDNIQFEIINPIVPSIIFIVPYRDRQKQYEFFAKHMKMVLEDYDESSYKILYIHQQDNREFNRGAIKNIGFITVKNMYPNDYSNITLVFNDVDTMPYTKNFLDYKTTHGIVKHFYGFQFTLGGIVSITAGDFEKVNGFPNFWAWGYEDNMLQSRILKAGITIDRSHFYNILDPNILHFPEGITRNINRTEYDAFRADTTEGINSIQNIVSQYDESTGFVNVTTFDTNREGNPQQTFAYDLRQGSEPFKPPAPRGRRGASMRMLI